MLILFHLFRLMALNVIACLVIRVNGAKLISTNVRVIHAHMVELATILSIFITVRAYLVLQVANCKHALCRWVRIESKYNCHYRISLSNQHL